MQFDPFYFIRVVIVCANLFISASHIEFATAARADYCGGQHLYEAQVQQSVQLYRKMGDVKVLVLPCLCRRTGHKASYHKNEKKLCSSYESNLDGNWILDQNRTAGTINWVTSYRRMSETESLAQTAKLGAAEQNIHKNMMCINLCYGRVTQIPSAS